MKTTPIRSFWWRAANFGDTLTPIIIKHFLDRKVEFVERNQSNKLLSVGSIIHCLKPGDVVFGTGTHRNIKIQGYKDNKFLAVRGPITRSFVEGADVPEVYGDPAILLPFIYKPENIKKTHDVGYLPHYVDKMLIPELKPGEKFIDIQSDWRNVINEVLTCKKIIASSLHGIIVAEAYGIPVEWAVYSDKIIGGPLKFHDYFLGSGRERYNPGHVLPPIPDLYNKQITLLEALNKAVKNNIL